MRWHHDGYIDNDLLHHPTDSPSKQKFDIKHASF